ncbi:MAG: UbiA family prenyltransferase, partial [Bifidobacteriaceae bacterium]|nr:UbiA family prenyltransferase [Bifidobacteriaceae bacterium]
MTAKKTVQKTTTKTEKSVSPAVSSKTKPSKTSAKKQATKQAVAKPETKPETKPKTKPSTVQNSPKKVSKFSVIRIHTLWASTFPAIIGIAASGAFFQTGQNNTVTPRIIGIILTAVILQIAANIINDAEDVENDLKSLRGSSPKQFTRGLLSNKESTIAGGLLVALGVFIGITTVLISPVSSAIKTTVLIFGALSVFFVYAYSSRKLPFSKKPIGEILAFFFYGIFATIGSYALLYDCVTGFESSITTFNKVVHYYKVDTEYTSISLPAVIILSLSWGLCSAILMFINNIRDIDQDKNYKQTIPIILGKSKSLKCLQIMIILTSIIPLIVSLLMAKVYTLPSMSQQSVSTLFIFGSELSLSGVSCVVASIIFIALSILFSINLVDNIKNIDETSSDRLV